MIGDEVKAMLEKNRAAIERQDQLHAEMEKKLRELDDGGSLLFGPQTELEFRRILRGIEEAGDEKE
ncbi:MAG: hypothetical protein RL748_1374 [Pseudomonadota bacterium]|jgi:hypothetical protein